MYSRFGSAVLLIVLSIVFTYLKSTRIDPQEIEFLGFAALFSLFGGLLKAFLVWEDDQYTETISALEKKQDEMLSELRILRASVGHHYAADSVDVHNVDTNDNTDTSLTTKTD